MAITFADVTPHAANTVGALKFRTVTITMDSSYPTGGESFTPAQVGLVAITQVLISQPPAYVVDYDYTNQKFLFYWTGAGTSAVLAQVTNTLDLSAVSFRVTFIGY